MTLFEPGSVVPGRSGNACDLLRVALCAYWPWPYVRHVAYATVVRAFPARSFMIQRRAHPGARCAHWTSTGTLPRSEHHQDSCTSPSAHNEARENIAPAMCGTEPMVVGKDDDISKSP
jgi:hypothetical protein